MKTEFTNTGWRIVTVTNFKVKQIVGPFFNRRKWIEFTRKHKHQPNKRNTGRFRCECCRKRWENVTSENINLAFMESKHKNQCLCEDCTGRLINSGVPFMKRKLNNKDEF